MDCDRCRERPARYHVKRVVNGETVRELDLCERCAAAEQGELAAAMAEPHLTIHQLLAGLLAGVGEAGGAGAGAGVGARCPRCGTSYAEFARTGLVGCQACYDAFGDQLEALIRRVHGKSRHEGKLPLRAGASFRTRRAVDELRHELEQAVAAEAFERAAELRDRIRALQGVADSGAVGPAAAARGGS